MTDYSQFLKKMPIIPDVATKILSITEEKLDISFKELENTIMLDAGLSTKILKVANSALYARQREVKSLQMAITLLGYKTIKSLVLLITASNMFSAGKSGPFYQFFWRHSVINAFLARDMARKVGARSISDGCFLAGLLHDIGQVALQAAHPEEYKRVLDATATTRSRISDLEEEHLGANHRDVGAEVLRSWSFPDVYVDSAAEHGSANITSPHKQPILIVSVADFVTSNIDLYTDQPLEFSLLRDVLRQTSLTEEDLVAYQEGFMDELIDDPLFRECKSLFQV